MLSTVLKIETSTVSVLSDVGVEKMNSNYRVIWNEDELFTIFEVYYDDEGNIEDWDDTVVSAVGSDFEDLCSEIEKMAAALELPILYINEEGDLVELEDDEDESEEA
jgi:ribosome-interacting GTPase 1